MTAPLAIDCNGLSKSYGNLKAADGVTFKVNPGEIFALLGPNGAGKSTTIKMLCTLARPTAGTAIVAGHDCVAQPHAVRRRIGLVFQDRTLDDQLTAEENLRFQAALYGVPRREAEVRIDRVLSVVGLLDRRSDRVGTFSGGMARRLEVARGLLHSPEVLFLDEPTLGLDPQNRARMWAEVLRLRDEEGVAVFFTTHYMEEAEFADRIAIIDHGRVVVIGTPAELKRRIGTDRVLLHTSDDKAALASLLAAGYASTAIDNGVSVAVENGAASVPAIIRALGVTVLSVQVEQPSLNDVFLNFTGRAIRDDAPDEWASARQIMSTRRG